MVTAAATASSPHHRAEGRPDHGAAAARTEELYRDHGRLVAGLCRALLRDRAEGEDAAQQVFLAAHRALLNGTSPREPAAWLATIARNECWARIRSRMREPLPTAEVDGATSLSDPLAEAIRNADLAAMWRAIADLPRQQRDALLLREFGGLSYEELAGALAVSGSAVESLLFRARQGVRARLEAAYAGLAGASWVESLGRLAGGVGGGMAPVAAKVAVVGVGAAVATGGAVVAPQMLERHHSLPRPSPVTRRHTVERSPPVIAASRAAPQTFTRSRTVPVALREHRGSSSSGRTSGSDDRGRDGHGRDGSGASGGPEHSGEGATAAETVTRESTQEDSAEQDGGRVSTSDEHGSSPDRADSSGGGDSSSGGEGSSHDGDSSGGRGGSDDGGVVTTITNQVVTVTEPTEDEPPALGGPGSGGHG